jgi:hypothetical protein
MKKTESEMKIEVLSQFFFTLPPLLFSSYPITTLMPRGSPQPSVYKKCAVYQNPFIFKAINRLWPQISTGIFTGIVEKVFISNACYLFFTCRSNQSIISART